jgi:nucleoside-diphosphate-sugar epimerase
MMHPTQGDIYNLCDDDPAPPQDVIGYAAKILGLPQPPEVDFETADLSPMARSFYSESKRVSNAKVKRDLGITLIHPTYKSGLDAMLASDQT